MVETSPIVEFDSRAVIPDHVIVRRIADEAVLLNLHTERYYGLDSVGRAMLSQATSSATLADAVEVLLQEYAVEREQMVKDFEAFLNQLLSAGLIEIVPSSSPS